ncbi:MAG: RNA-binding transcriptional accessory protein [Lactobacillales bacterium]|jgi:uncharacterized protein|nr:RNA-binding transcriptional accessory protein [Lactobacillales bacterium]
MNEKIIKLTHDELKTYKLSQIENVITLTEEGSTIPFIARYRKEKTQNLDEVEINDIVERYNYLTNLEKQKEDIVRKIDEQGKLSPELTAAIEKASKLTELEDIYRPYKQKRLTKAVIAKNNGLEPLALWILKQDNLASLDTEAAKYLNDEIADIEAAKAGAHEIIAEIVSDESKYRSFIRNYLALNAQVETSVKKDAVDEKKVYEIYYDFVSPYQKLQPHQMLAITRAEKEGVIKLNVTTDNEPIENYFKGQLNANEFVLAAALDAYKRFIFPAIERELMGEKLEISEESAIDTFALNLKNLLLIAPLKNKIILGFDPAFRTGCKLAIINENSKVLAIDKIYPHVGVSDAQRAKAEPKFIDLLKKYNVDIIAIGNGTASRESIEFVANAVKKLDREVLFTVVNEAGASVYSASENARKEFPDLQVEERSAVSIARRLQDPLAELVKIEPKAVGVGLYQHDVNQKRLGEKLDFVVSTAVNAVGVDVNTASAELLSYVSGMNKTSATNLIELRDELGGFTKRTQLKKTKRFGEKSYEQAVGFLRIMDGKDILDATSIHPESYKIAKEILKEASVKPEELGTPEAKAKLEALKRDALIAKMEVGEFTLDEIIQALNNPKKDVRANLAGALLRSDVLKMEDLKPGMKLTGTIRNVIAFGAFVDIGVKEDGLVHISKLSNKFVKEPSDVVKVGDIVDVWVIDVDLNRKRISLSMVGEK